MKIATITRAVLPLGAALALAACGGAGEEDTEYEVGTEDLSGGELITTDPNEERVDVNLPETEMTNASQEEIEAAQAAEEDAEEAPE